MTPVPVIETPVIETRQLSIQFGGHIAVNCLDLKVTPHCLKSVIGPNGAGKTTLFNLISGQYTPSSGKILFNGRDITRMGVADRTKLGIGRSFQLTNIFPSLTVLENVRLALQAKENVGMVFWKHYKTYPKLAAQAYELLKQVMLADKHGFMASLLTHGEQRKLEIAILLALDPDVLLLVEHKFDMIMALSDSIAVLQEGRIICDDTPDAVSNNEKVLEAYLGGGVTHA